MNREMLETKYDGKIPAHLLDGRTQAELQADHHRAMISFSEVRIKDFAAQLEQLLTETSSVSRDSWIDRTRQNLAWHREEIARHTAALEALSE